MADDNYDRLLRGFQAADAAGDEANARLFGQALRDWQSAGANTNVPVEPNNVFSSFGNAFRANVDPVLEGMGTTAEVLGAPGLGQSLKDATSMPEGYQSSSSEFMNEGGEGYNWNALPGAVAEQAGQFAGSIAARGVGAVGGAAVGSLAGPGGAAAGGAVGAFAGPALFEGMQILGPIAQERAKNNGREEPNYEDLQYAFATAAASGALNALAPGAQGMLRRAILEGGTEGLQSAVQQTGETAGTDAGWEVSGKQALGEGIIGAGSAGAVDTTLAAADVAAQPVRKAAEVVGDFASRYDDDFTIDQRRAAERLVQAADGDMEVLGDVNPSNMSAGAQGAAKAALQGLRAEADVLVNEFRALARGTKNTEGLEAINALRSTIGEMTSRVPDNFTNRVAAAFPEAQDAVARLRSLGHQANAIQDFTSGKGDMGGFSKFTSRFDVTDARASGLVTGGMLAAGNVLPAIGTLGTLGSSIAVNRVARVVDNLTNNRSRVKRFVDSARRQGPTPDEIQGERPSDILDRYKLQKSVKQAQDTLAMGLAKEEHKAKQRAENDARKKEADDRRKSAAREDQLDAEWGKYHDRAVSTRKTAEAAAKKLSELTLAKTTEEAVEGAQAALYAARLTNTAPMFESGVIPEQPYFDGYRKWQEHTGLDPKQTLQGLQELEQAGDPAVPQGTTQRYQQDIRGFANDPMVYEVQQALIRKFNPGFKYTPPQKTKPTTRAIDKLHHLTDIKPEGNRRKFKARQGEQASLNLGARIEDAKDQLPVETYLGLLKLRQQIDSPSMTTAMREEAIRAALPGLFKTKAGANVWLSHFGPLVAIGNDYVIERQESPAAQAETEADIKLAEAVQGAKKKKKTKKAPLDQSKTPDAANINEAPKTRAEKALEKLKDPKPEPKPEPEPEEAPSQAEAEREAKDPDFDAPTPEKKAPGRNSLKNQAADRIEKLWEAVYMAEKQPELAEYVRSLPKGNAGRVEAAMYEMASSRLTVNMLTERFASEFSMPLQAAADAVNAGLAEMETKGLVKRFVPKHNARVMGDRKPQRDQNEKSIYTVDLQVLDPDMAHRMEIAKAVNMAATMVDQKVTPAPYSPNQLRQGAHRAFKNYSGDYIDGSFKPILDFLNALRESPLMVSETMLTQMEDALANTGKNVGTIAQQLTPKSKKKLANGKTKTETDRSPLRAFSQLVFQLGTKGERRDNRIRQEWMAGDNLRVYSRNGAASSQGGDMMKGIFRSPTKAPLKDQAGVDFMFHGFGNLLGYDKESPLARRQALLNDPEAVDALIEFADNPFGRTTLETSTGNAKPIARILKDADGRTPEGTYEAFFQVLNVANEVKALTAWARERHPKLKKLSNTSLLQHPAVRADFANYETDFIVQLDANNNAYQLAGSALGDTSVLQATGMLPTEGAEGPADARKGADIYMAPALAIAERMPELTALREAGLSDSKLRKLFKGPIGTFLYAAEYQSRRKSFEDTLKDIADGADVFGIGGTGLIEVPANVVSGLQSEEGFRFVKAKFDENGDTVSERPVRQRIVEVDGKFYRETAEGDRGAFKRPKFAYGSREEAIIGAFESDFYGRLNRELVRDLRTRFPRVNDYLNFAEVVSRIVRENAEGRPDVKVPTPDGMMLTYNFKDVTQYEGVPVDLGNGNVVNMGVRGTPEKIRGRGLAAFMTHQLDAYVLRESHKRLMGNGGLMAFNPIHDSFGFHPAEAARGQETVVTVMQEIAQGDYNLFVSILQANGISIPQFLQAGGTLPERGDVPQVPPSEIPTAVS